MNKDNSISSEQLSQMQTVIEQLTTRMNSQEDELKQLRQQVINSQQANLSSKSEAGQEKSTSRRRMLKKLGAAAAGLAIAGAAVATNTQTAEAANVDLAGDNPIGNPGTIRPNAGSFSPNPTIQINSDSTVPFTINAPKNAGLLAAGSNTNYGIIAVSGPVDINTTDLTTANPALKPAAIMGRSGQGAGGNTDGNIGVHGVADAQAGVMGQFQGVGQVIANAQINDSSALLQAGVIGASDTGVGIIAASNLLTGLYASSSGNLGYSILASRGGHNQATGVLDPTKLNLAPLRIEPSPTAGPPTSNGHRVGEVHIDKDGRVWVCTKAGSTTAPPPGSGRGPVELRQAAPAAPGVPSVGTFSPLSSINILNTPIRIVGPNNTVNPNFVTTNLTPKYFKMEGTWTNNNGGGPVTDTIPAEASAIIGAITIIYPANSGYGTVFPGNLTSAPVTASVGYAGVPGNISVSTVLVKLGALNSGPDVGKKGIGIITFTSVLIAFDVFAYIL